MTEISEISSEKTEIVTSSRKSFCPKKNYNLWTVRHQALKSLFLCLFDVNRLDCKTFSRTPLAQALNSLVLNSWNNQCDKNLVQNLTGWIFFCHRELYLLGPTRKTSVKPLSVNFQIVWSFSVYISIQSCKMQARMREALSLILIFESNFELTHQVKTFSDLSLFSAQRIDSS